MALFLCISLPTFLFLNKGVVFKNSTSERFTYIFDKRGGILATKTEKNASGSLLSHRRCYLSKNPNFGRKYLHCAATLGGTPRGTGKWPLNEGWPIIEVHHE